MRRNGTQTVQQRELARYVAQADDKRAVCEALSISPAMLSYLINGRRAITPDMALKIEKHSRELQPRDPVDKAVLVWGSQAYEG